MHNLNGKHAVFVGGTGGIGRALAKLFHQEGAMVTVVGQTLRDQLSPNFSFIPCDLSLMENAQNLAQNLKKEKIDFLVFTTGIFAAPQKEITKEGLERDWAVSFLNRLVILDVLSPHLKGAEIDIWGYPGKNQKGNILDLNSQNHYSAFSSHMNTVAGNEILVKVFSEKYPQNIYCGFNPGLIKTNIRDNLFGKNSLKSKVMEFIIGLFTPTVEDYAQNLLPVFFKENKNGLFFNAKGKIIPPSKNIDAIYAENFLKKARETLPFSIQ